MYDDLNSLQEDLDEVERQRVSADADHATLQTRAAHAETQLESITRSNVQLQQEKFVLQVSWGGTSLMCKHSCLLLLRSFKQNSRAQQC